MFFRRCPPRFLPVRLAQSIASSLAVLVAGGLLFASPQPSGSDLKFLKQWIAKQADIRTVSADFTQTRTLHTLRSPLVSSGRLWFMAPDWFRWELGDPPKTIIIGTPKGVTVIQPGKKRATRNASAGPGGLPDSGPLGMMRLPGGGSFEEFQRKVQVLAFDSSKTSCHLEMLPRDAARGLSAIKLEFDTATGDWISLEILTREGSSIRNAFSNVRVNPKLEKQLFEYDLTGFKITDEEN